MFSSRPKTPEEIQKFVWELYNKAQADKQNDRPPLYTKDFFDKLPLTLKNDFYKSPLSVIQFGIGTAQEIIQCFPYRKIIGYDFSNLAIQESKKKGITTRHVDLSEINSKTNSLSYIAQLKIDLSEPVNILLIRILTALKPEAAKLLLIAICDLSQPGTKICFENWNHSSAGIMDITTGVTLDYLAPYNWVSSFFNPWPDFKNAFCKISHNGLGEHIGDRGYNNETTSTERYVFEKTDQCPYLDDEIPYQHNTAIISSLVDITLTAKLKAEYYVDATLDMENVLHTTKDKICNKLTSLKIPHRICLFGEKKLLVIPNINVRESVEPYLSSLQKKI